MSEPKPELAEIQNLPIAELSELLGALDAGELRELREIEAGQENPRKGALAAIDEALLAHEPVTSEQATEAAPAWQSPDYAGPLDIEQSQWRLHNIKPVREVSTK